MFIIALIRLGLSMGRAWVKIIEPLSTFVGQAFNAYAQAENIRQKNQQQQCVWAIFFFKHENARQMKFIYRTRGECIEEFLVKKKKEEKLKKQELHTSLIRCEKNQK